MRLRLAWRLSTPTRTASWILTRRGRVTGNRATQLVDRPDARASRVQPYRNFVRKGSLLLVADADGHSRIGLASGRSHAVVSANRLDARRALSPTQHAWAGSVARSCDRRGRGLNVTLPSGGTRSIRLPGESEWLLANLLRPCPAGLSEPAPLCFAWTSLFLCRRPNRRANRESNYGARGLTVLAFLMKPAVG